MARPRRARRGWLLPALMVVGGGLALGALALSLYAERTLSALVLGGLGESFSTRLYSAPHDVPDGSFCPPDRLLARLDRLAYRAGKTVEKPGDYAWTPPTLDLWSRGFKTPVDQAEPARLALRWDGTRWEVKDGAGALATLRLEPEVVAELSGAKKIRREPADSGEIPDQLKHAVVSAEDHRFYRHWGLDPRGIARALWSNLRGRGPMQGGSTITQQLSKNLFLTPHRTLKRKLAEAFLALYLEARYGKDRILTIYLNHIYLGQDGPTSVAGVKAAARFYFGRDLRELSLAECATLAGLIRSPHRYNPFLDPDESKGRRDFVLKRMRDDGWIDDSQLAAARAEPLRVAPPSAVTRPRGDADYFTAEVVRQLLPRFGEETLFRHGLSLYTTLDPQAQRDAQRAVASARPQGALVALDPRTGAVLALSGGRDFAESQFNRATQARRQPGSAFKPFVYGAALEKGLTAASELDDSPKKYPRSTDGPTWDPRNYEGVYFGTTTLRTALAHSLNAATLDLANKIGIPAVVDFARRMGVESPLAADLGTALGASEVTLYELVGAYQPFGQGGTKRPPRLVLAVTDAEGEVLEADPLQETPAVDAQDAWLLTSLLQTVVREGTGKPLAALGWARPTAGKTGTTNDGRDAWFVGFTPGLVAGVWVGDDRHKPLRATGARNALPVWHRFMKAAAAEQDPAADFPRPDGLVDVVIDPSSGLKAVAGCPTRVTEVFKRGTEPSRDCPLHPTGIKGFFQRLFRRRR